MNCPQCGTQNDNSARNCVQCGAGLQPQGGPQASPGGAGGQAGGPGYPGVGGPGMPVKIANHLVWAILVTIFCCLPLGIVAIVYAAQVNGKVATGDFAGAQNSANKAKMWIWIGFGVGLAIQIVVVGINVFVGTRGF